MAFVPGLSATEDYILPRAVTQKSLNRLFSRLVRYFSHTITIAESMRVSTANRYRGPDSVVGLLIYVHSDSSRCVSVKMLSIKRRHDGVFFALLCRCGAANLLVANRFQERRSWERMLVRLSADPLTPARRRDGCVGWFRRF